MPHICLASYQDAYGVLQNVFKNHDILLSHIITNGDRA